MSKFKMAIHKFTSCDGCQLAFLNAGENLLLLSELVEIIHFPEAGLVDADAKVDITFVEGSISTPKHLLDIEKVRKNTKYLITIGACATAGGIQALRNIADDAEWLKAIYASPQHISTLATSTAIADHVSVDWELWGCPVNSKQVYEAIRFLLFNTSPKIKKDAVCMECKRQGNICVMVTKKKACMGPVTQLGCGALCPSVNRECYACYGPKENVNTQSLGDWFKYLGLTNFEIANKFSLITNNAGKFKEAAQYFKGIKIEKK